MASSPFPVRILFVFVWLGLTGFCASTDNSSLPPKLGNPSASSALGAHSFIAFQEQMNEGYYDAQLDVEDVDAYFSHVFSRLPAEVTIYPSENYYYFIDCIKGMQIWGNVRLPAGRREQGVISFGYAEYIEFPTGPGGYLSRAKYFTEADGLTIKEIDKFTYIVRFKQKAVTFHLHKLSQEPPSKFQLKPNETFIERTFDESGLQFFLLFNTERNYFFWVLNEEEKVPDGFTELEEDIVVGRRTGFAFWLDEGKGGRKVLAAVRKLSVTRNDHYDGPFDQLADNDVDKTKISEWMERAIPSIKGRIDKYGYYTDTERPTRVALSCYGTYDTQADIVSFIQRAKNSPDPYQFISRGGALPP